MEAIKISKDGKTYLIGRASAARPLEGWEVPVNARRQLIARARPVSPNNWQGLWQLLKLDAPGSSPSKPLSEGDIRSKLQEAIDNNKLAVVREHINPRSPKDTSSQRKSESGTEKEEVRAQDKATSTPPPAGQEAKPVDSSKPAKTSPEAQTGAAPEAETETRGCPISMVSGEELLSLVDAELPGPLPFQWKRSYRSSQRRDIGLGVSWTHSGCEQLLFGNEQIDYYDSEGRILPLAIPRVGQTSRYLPEGLTLLHPSEGYFVLEQQGQPDRVFARVSTSSVYRLTQLRHAGYRPVSGNEGGSGFAINFHYNAHNRITRIAGNWGQTLVVERDASGHVQSIDLLNEESGQRKRLASYQYNDLDELIAQRNANAAGEDYLYDHHLLKQRTLATGFSYYYEWDGTDASARCLHNWGDDGIYDYRFEWDPDNNTSRATDSRGFTTTFQYNEYGLISEEIDNEGGRHQYRYENGRKVAYLDPLGHETHYFYDEDSFPLGHRDPLGQQESLSWFKGQLTRYTGKDKGHWQYEYNSHGQLAARIDPYGQRSEYRYNRMGLVSEIRAGKHTTRYQWRDNGYLQSLTDPEGHKRIFHYDDWGQVTEVELRLKGKIFAGKQQYTYTPTGRLASVTDAQGRTRTYTYNNNDQLIEYCDAQGRVTQFEYDGLSQVVKRRDAEGHTLEYEYDKERNLIGLINENGERYSFEYDGNERLIRETGFDGREQTYEYNTAGQLVQHTDAGEVVTSFERDALGHMQTKLSRSLSDPSRPEELARYAYDPVGRLKECYNTQHYLAFEYNHFGKIVREHRSDLNAKRQRIKGSARDIEYRYLWPGLRSHLHLPDGQQIRYEYDEDYRLKSIHHNDQQITQIQRDEFGREIAREQGALVSEIEYDPHSRLQKQIAWNRENKSQKPIERHYGYDEFGNLNQIKDGPVETRYVYDLLNRLKLSEHLAGDQKQQEVFHFDPAGNRLDAEANKSKGNRLAFMGDRKFTYDARGNLIKENRGKEGKLETRYHYNLNNQLIKLEKGGQSTEYYYDPLGRRTQKRDEFGCTNYLWAGDQLVQEERAQSKKTYVFEPESYKPVAMVQDNQVYHYHLDHLGTPRELSANDGKIVWKARYLTYGNVALKEVDEVENNLRFQGQYYDEESGLHYNRHRYYDPGTGQFTTQDPIGLLGGVNNYQYAPNPTNWVDPLGLTCKEVSSDLQRHLDKLPDGSYKIIDVVETPASGGFAGKRAVEIELLQDIDGYRYFGGDAKKEGGFIAIGELPSNMQQKRQKLALSPFYDTNGRTIYNTMDNVVDVNVGKGTKVLLGEVAPQQSRQGKKYVGGGTQILTQFWLPENKGKISYSKSRKVK